MRRPLPFAHCAADADVRPRFPVQRFWHLLIYMLLTLKSESQFTLLANTLQWREVEYHNMLKKRRTR
jgi:hypothetical protein